MFSTICWTQLNIIGSEHGFHENINQFHFFHKKVNKYYLLNKLMSNRIINFVNWRKAINNLVQFLLFFRLENKNLDWTVFHPFIIQSSLFCLYYISLLKCDILICASDILLVSALV